jgi:hypothetical protein
MECRCRWVILRVQVWTRWDITVLRVSNVEMVPLPNVCSYYTFGIQPATKAMSTKNMKSCFLLWFDRKMSLTTSIGITSGPENCPETQTLIRLTLLAQGPIMKITHISPALIFPSVWASVMDLHSPSQMIWRPSVSSTLSDCSWETLPLCRTC